MLDFKRWIAATAVRVALLGCAGGAALGCGEGPAGPAGRDGRDGPAGPHQTGAGVDALAEKLTLAFGRVCVEYKKQKPDGTLEPTPIVFEFTNSSP